MTHYSNTDNPIDFPKKKDIPMLEQFAAQSLVEHDGELIFSKERFAELIVRECARELSERTVYVRGINAGTWIKKHFGIEE